MIRGTRLGDEFQLLKCDECVTDFTPVRTGVPPCPGQEDEEILLKVLDEHRDYPSCKGIKRDEAGTLIW